VIVLGLVRHRGAVRERRAHRRPSLGLGQDEVPGLRAAGGRLEIRAGPVGVRPLACELDRVGRSRKRQRHQCGEDHCESRATYGEATANTSFPRKVGVLHARSPFCNARRNPAPRAAVAAP
jgi:hypothetical protein